MMRRLPIRISSYGAVLNQFALITADLDLIEYNDVNVLAN